MVYRVTCPCLSFFWRTFCCTIYSWDVWRSHHSRVPHRDVDVLYKTGADRPRWLLVWVQKFIYREVSEGFNARQRSRETDIFIYWITAVLMNGFAVIVLGFIAFGVLHTSTENFEPWQWCVLWRISHGITSTTRLQDDNQHLRSYRLMIITGIITLITAILFWYGNLGLCPLLRYLTSFTGSCSPTLLRTLGFWARKTNGLQC